MPFTPMERQADELSSLMLFVDAQREALLAKLDGLTLDQATSTPTPSSLSVFAIVKHCAHVERRWVQAGVLDREVPGIWPNPPERREKEFVAEEGETLDSLRAFYTEVVEENRAVLDGLRDLDTPVMGGAVDHRWILLHLIEELARHCGQADVIREAIDGAVEEP